jgi:hypothetical protein
MQDWIREADFRRLTHVRRGGPIVLLPYLIVSIIFAAGVLRMTERVSGIFGWVLMLPVTAALIAALAVSLLLTRVVIEPWTANFWWPCGAFAIGALFAPAIRIIREG